MRKPLPSSKLKTLPDADQEALADFLIDATLAEGVGYIKERCQVETSISAMSEWLKWFKMLSDVRTWNGEVEQLKAALTADALDSSLVAKIGEAVFIAKASRDGDAKTFAAVASIIQRDAEARAQASQHADKITIQQKKLSLAERDLERKLRELEHKLGDLDKTLEAPLTAEERITRMRQIFGR